MYTINGTMLVVGILSQGAFIVKRKYLSVLAITLTSTFLGITEVSASSGATLTPQKTNVVLDAGPSSNQGEGFSVATPDGRYVEIQSKDGNHSWLESMTGQRYTVPLERTSKSTIQHQVAML